MTNDQKFDRIINELIDIKTDIKVNMVTKAEFTNFRAQVLTTLDQHTLMLQRLDQERLFTYERIKRIEDDLADKTKDLKKIKQLLKIGQK